MASASSLLSIPLDALFGQTVAYNLLFLLTFWLSGFGMYLLVLHVTGRDIEDDSSRALKWDQRTATWTLIGRVSDIPKTTERREVLEVLQLMKRPATAREIGMSPGTAPMIWSWAKVIGRSARFSASSRTVRSSASMRVF